MQLFPRRLNRYECALLSVSNPSLPDFTAGRGPLWPGAYHGPLRKRRQGRSIGTRRGQSDSKRKSGGHGHISRATNICCCSYCAAVLGIEVGIHGQTIAHWALGNAGRHMFEICRFISPSPSLILSFAHYRNTRAGQLPSSLQEFATTELVKRIKHYSLRPSRELHCTMLEMGYTAIVSVDRRVICSLSAQRIIISRR